MSHHGDAVNQRRLLHRRHPAITPTALIDTLRLARRLKLGTKNSLSVLTDHLGLTPQIERLAPGSQPHRALWDTIATALLLSALVTRAWPVSATIADLLSIAAIDPATASQAKSPKPAAQESLFDPATWLAAPAPPTQTIRRKGRK